MSEAGAIQVEGRGQNRMLSAFAGLAALSLFSVLSGALFSLARSFGLLDGLTPEALAQHSSTLNFIALLVAGLATAAIGWWLRRQGSVLWGVSLLAVVGVWDGFVRGSSWIDAVRRAQGDADMVNWSVSYLPFLTPVPILVLLVFLGAGAQKLRENFK
ncbi:hypothetical protein [Maricaulis parjimensis]|uniref:hypothetical protein n=1 Tax=Maricaulis parjimensis TaxID=144023 RepID=UPI00193A18B8|nr:hypothetical protein [Maricaulis parjimensis]